MNSCGLCGKSARVGRNRSHAQNRTPRMFSANIQKVTLKVGGRMISGRFCSKCLKRLRLETKEQKTALAKG